MGRKTLAHAKEPKRVKLLLLLLLSALGIPLALPVSVHSQSSAPPEFPSAATARYLAENSDPFSAVGPPIVATDPDPRQILTYSLSGRDAEFFAIVERSGQLEILHPLDYETRSSYHVTVRATDPAGLSDAISVNVEVTNVDEIGEIVLTEKMLSFGPELNADLTDPDGKLSDVTWQWAVSVDRIVWKAIPGADFASYSPAPEDLRQYLRVHAQYSDGHGPGKVAERLFTKDLWPAENNHPPEFPFSESGVRNVGLDVSTGHHVGRPVLASDLDRDLLTYRLSGDASQLFEIGPHTGQLKAKSALDRQLEGRYFGVVHVFDGRGGTASKTVRVDVGNIPATALLTASQSSSPSVEDVVAPTPLATVEGHLGPGPKTALATLQPAWPQVRSTTSDSVKALGSVPGPNSSLPQGAQEGPQSATEHVSQETDESTVEKAGATEVDEEPVAVLGVMGSSSPSLPQQGVLTEGIDPSGGNGPVTAAESDALGSLFAWVAWLFLGVLVLGAILVLLSRTRRTRERDISLPPPTVGAERRIGSLPIIVSQLGKDDRPDVENDRVKSHRAENS